MWWAPTEADEFRLSGWCRNVTDQRFANFAVDLSAHITYAFVTCDAPTKRSRAVVALETLGWPVFQVRE